MVDRQRFRDVGPTDSDALRDLGFGGCVMERRRESLGRPVAGGVQILQGAWHLRLQRRAVIVPDRADDRGLRVGVQRGTASGIEPLDRRQQSLTCDLGQVVDRLVVPPLVVGAEHDQPVEGLCDPVTDLRMSILAIGDASCSTSSGLR